MKVNLYSLALKILGIGYICIGATLIILKRTSNIFIISVGMAFGIVFIGIGEIINILQKMYDKNRENI